MIDEPDPILLFNYRDFWRTLTCRRRQSYVDIDDVGGNPLKLQKVDQDEFIMNTYSIITERNEASTKM